MAKHFDCSRPPCAQTDADGAQKKTAAYKGQDPAKVTHYLTRPAGFSDCQRVCPDETGFDRRLFRPYARSLKGQMAKARIRVNRCRRRRYRKARQTAIWAGCCTILILITATRRIFSARK
ncbi:hypothetical protein A9Y60_03660 [Neisseria gonorrhoeae]|nr:hypothetical protein A9Y60_03660 [Neisseria gonorrhoeae]ASQ72508.1 hypothetical protein BZG33_04025 [Neisseria gonorrhoeae]ASQ74799.1 hypothetical protein BZG34_02105 [Neisseria gonorrhoeae]